jgi:uncharacterized integral membrane protein
MTEEHPEQQHQRGEKPSAGQRARKGLSAAAVIIFILLFIGLLIFILQNLQDVTIKYFGVRTQMPAGLALFLAALAGAALAAIIGAARRVRLRLRARREQQSSD